MTRENCQKLLFVVICCHSATEHWKPHSLPVGEQLEPEGADLLCFVCKHIFSFCVHSTILFSSLPSLPSPFHSLLAFVLAVSLKNFPLKSLFLVSHPCIYQDLAFCDSPAHWLNSLGTLAQELKEVMERSSPLVSQMHGHHTCSFPVQRMSETPILTDALWSQESEVPEMMVPMFLVCFKEGWHRWMQAVTCLELAAVSPGSGSWHS